MDISVRNKGEWVNEDQRWIGNGGEPIGKNRSIILDRSAFVEADHFPNGFIPSGTPLARIASTGLYGPYVRSTLDVQTISVNATSGTWRITDPRTGESAVVAFNVSAANLRLALEALPDIEIGDLAVTGGPGNSGATTPYVITAVAGGQFDGVNGPLFVVADVDLAGGGDAVANVETTPGAESVRGEGRGYLFTAMPVDRESTGDLAGALFWNGEVIEQYLPTMPTANSIDDAFRADVTFISHV